MYRAVEAYNIDNEGVLSFQVGDLFNLIEEIDEHWWSMQDEFGNYGLVPATFLEVNNVKKERVLESIQKSIESMKQLAERQQRPITDKEKRNMQKLTQTYEIIKNEDSLWGKKETRHIPIQPKRQAPKAPGSSTTKNRSSKRHSAPAPPAGVSPADRSSSSSGSPTSPLSPTGVASKVYNIQVTKGQASPILSNEMATTESSLSNTCNVKNANPSSKTSVTIETNETETSSMQRTNLDRINDNKMSELTVLKGTNLTITKADTEKTHTVTTTGSTRETKQNTENESSVELRDSFSSNSRTPSFNSNTTTCSLDSSSQTLVPSSTTYMASIDHVTDEFGKQLVDDVRARCKISFNKALAAVRCVLHRLGHEVPSICDVTSTIERQLQDDKLNVYQGSLAAADAQRLYSVLDQLTEHQEDSQQRNWAVHEDFQTIKELLDELLLVMDEIDPSISRTVLQQDECRYINGLITYFQMEHRAKLRVSLIHVFGCFCQLGKEFVSTLLCSVLPTELAQDMMQDQSEILKFVSSALMLTMIFSTAEPIPYQHYVQFNDDFVNFVLNFIEEPPDNDIDDQVSDTLIGMLLSFNQHFRAPRSSTLIQVLKTRSVFRTLTEKILLLLNRETDPCAMFEFVNPCPDSVLKFLIDVFSTKDTSAMFFTNDLYVLFDIILRQITNREAKDKVRTEYLSLFHSILNTTDYYEHQRHATEFKRQFSEILSNEENESEVDIYIVREIVNRFGDLFGTS